MTNDSSEISSENIIPGAFAINQSDIQLLDLQGNQQANYLVDTLLDTNLDRFNSFMEKEGLDPTLAAHVLADATTVDTLQESAVIYLLGLVGDAQQISSRKGISYWQLSPDDRTKLVNFLYRPPKERPLTWAGKIGLLYPDFGDQIAGTTEVNHVLNVNQEGLSKVLISLLESENLQYTSNNEVSKLWHNKSWQEYITPRGIPQNEDKLMDVKGTLANFNMPDQIEYLALDVRDCMDLGFNLTELIKYTQQVLPKRKKLSELHYFRRDTPDLDRYIMLRKIFDNELLL